MVLAHEKTNQWKRNRNLPDLGFYDRFSVKTSGDFPGGAVVKNLPSNAGDMGSIPGWGTKIPHATGQLNPRATTTEPANHNY